MSDNDQRIVTYDEFLANYKKTHDRKTSSLPPTTRLNQIWKELKEKHHCNKQKYKHHGGIKAFPSEFHIEAQQKMLLWKLQNEQKKAANKSMFFGLFLNQNRKSKKQKLHRRPNDTEHNVNGPSLKYRRCDKNKIKSQVLVQKESFIKSINNLSSYTSLKEMVNDGSLQEIQNYFKSGESRDLHKLFDDANYKILLSRLQGIRGNNKWKTPLYHAIIYESKLFKNEQYPSLHELFKRSEQYKYVKTLNKGNFATLTQLIITNRTLIKTMREYSDYKYISLWLDLCCMVQLENILKSIHLNKLQTNYKQNRTYRTQTTIIDDIRNIDKEIASLSFFHTESAKADIEALDTLKTKYLNDLEHRQREAINQRNFRERKKSEMQQIEETYDITLHRDVRGPRRIEERPGNGHLYSALQDIIDEYCLADPRRRTEVAIYVGNIPHCVSQMKAAGIILSKDSVRRRFKPANKATNTAKRYHTKTVNAQCKRIQNGGREMHISARWNFQHRINLKQMFSYLGNNQCFYIGLDDKDRIKLGTVILIELNDHFSKNSDVKS